METREKSEVSVTLQGGASIVQCKPQFSIDSKYLMCASGHVIKVLSIRSGECVHVLKGHKGTVTGIQINPNNHNQIFSSSLDKTVIKWDYRDGILIREYKLTSPVCVLFVPDTTEQNVFTVLKKSKTVHQLSSFSPPAQNEDVTSNDICPVSGKHAHVAISKKGDFAAHIDGSNLTVCKLSSLEARKTKTHTYKDQKQKNRYQELTCVECHPTEQSVVTGVSDGKILLWHNIFSSSKVVMQVNHWHSLAVEHLSFTTEGSYLLSGGHECVLVKWHWTTHHKDFLPRLGSPIINITCSPDNTHYALCHRDNGIQIVSSSSKVIQSFQGLNQAHIGHSKAWKMAVGLHIDPKTNAIVTNGQAGHLQFYDVHKDQQICMLDVVGQNYVSPDSLDKVQAITYVECIDFDGRGDWLGTVERWDNGIMPAEIRLKFWVYVPTTKGYKLNTLVDLPHDKEVTEFQFRPQTNDNGPLMAVTASKDGYFKIWALVDDIDIYKTSQCWRCESVGFYREQLPGSLDFSQDGTLLAVTFDMTLTLWDPETASMHAVFTLPQNDTDDDKISNIVFGRGSCSHFLMVSTTKILYVWNLLTCAVSWSVPTSSAVIAQSPVSELFAVFSSGNLRVYRPDIPDPVYFHGKLPYSVRTALFVPQSQRKDKQMDCDRLAWQNDAQLYFMTKHQELMTFRYADDLAEKRHTLNLMSQDVPQTPFSILLSEKKQQGSSHGRSSGALNKRLQNNFVKEMLSTPAHVMPPTTTLVNAFVGSLLNKSNKCLEDEDDEDMDIDPSSYRRSSSTQEANKSDSDSDDMDTTDGVTGEKDGLREKMDTLNIAGAARSGDSEKRELLSKEYRKRKPKTFKWL